MAGSEQNSAVKFRGPSAIALDSKHRLAVPKRYRQALQDISDGNVVVTAHPHGCLLLYPSETWFPIEEEIMSRPSFDVGVADIQELVVGMAVEGSLDATGRVLLPVELREYAELDKEVMLVGQFSHFKVWSKEAWDLKNKSRKFESGKAYVMPESFRDFSF